MKKYFASILFGLVIGVVLSKTILEEYDDYTKIGKVSSSGVNAYFIKYGEYESLSDLEKNTISLTNYIYTKQNDKYSVYIGITTSEQIKDKLVDYFEKLNYSVATEEFVITNEEYINYLKNADKLLENTSDLSVIGEVCSQILSKYEELVINDSKD